jgi:hypothetical protein
MKFQKTLIAAGIAALIPLSATTLAGEGKDKAGATAQFDALDANRDGRISQAEAAVDSTITFSTADADGDGYLSKAEWKKSSKGGSHDQMPQSSPQSTEPVSPTDPTQPQPVDPSSTPQSDTEAPRQ